MVCHISFAKGEESGSHKEVFETSRKCHVTTLNFISSHLFSYIESESGPPLTSSTLQPQNIKIYKQSHGLAGKEHT